MGYVYAAMWLIAGLILIFRLSKENKIFYVAGGFFLVLGVWWLLDSLFPDWKVFQGTPGAVLKVLTFIVLVVLAIVFFILNRRGWKAEAAMKKITFNRKIRKFLLVERSGKNENCTFYARK